MSTECQGHWRLVESKTDGEGRVDKLACSDCTDEWYIAYDPRHPGGRTIAERKDGVLRAVG